MVLIQIPTLTILYSSSSRVHPYSGNMFCKDLLGNLIFLCMIYLGKNDLVMRHV